MRIPWIAALAAPLLLAAGPLVTPEDSAFLAAIVAADSGQIALGHLAMSHSRKPAIRQFGERLASWHDAHRVRAAAMAKLIGVPTSAALSPDSDKAVARLSALTGPAFDTAYKEQIIADLQKNVADCQALANSAGNPGVRMLAAQTAAQLGGFLKRTQTL